MKTLRFFLACLLLCPVMPVTAQETMDETTLRQHMIMAEGKPPDSYFEEDRTTSTIGDVAQVEFHRGIDYRVIFNDRLFHDEVGRFEGHIWDQDANGLTTIHDLPAGNERPMPTKVTVTRVTQPLNAWKETQLNPVGFGRIRYVDPVNFHVVRLESLTRYGTITSDYDDFRTVNGFTQPYHWKTDNQVSKTQSEGNVVAFDVRPVTDGDLAIPPSRPFVSFPSDRASVELPTTFLYDTIIVRVMVGDRGLDLALDSGASGIAIDGQVVKELGLRTSPSHSAVTAGRYETRQAIIPEMRVGDLTMHNVAVNTIPFAFDYGPYTNQRTTAVGLLGYDFLRSVGLTIDYAHRHVTAFPAGSYQPPVMTPDSDILPIRLGDHVPEISATINGASAEHVVVDTGGGTSLILFDYFTARYPEAISPKVTTFLGNMPGPMSGIGGPFESKPVRLMRVGIGKYNIPNAVAFQVVSLRRFQFNLDALVGYEFLKHFTVGFDYAAGKMYLVRNEGE
ncbi:MAG TPA: aspartyl protease family protein [Candidatus Baltobacteraceae bacterium]